MKKKSIAILLLCLAIFTMIPLATVSAASNVQGQNLYSGVEYQVQGQGSLFFDGYIYGGGAYYGPEASFKITNANGQVVWTGYRAVTSSGQYFSFEVSGLPYGTYTITAIAETPHSSVVINDGFFR